MLDVAERLAGVYRGIVADNDDPEGLLRVRVRIQSLTGDQETAWAWPSVPALGGAKAPSVGDPVWISFEEGDIDRPVYLGTWVPVQTPGSPTSPEAYVISGGTNVYGATSATMFASEVTGDTAPRFEARANGDLRWGGGAVAADVFLGRTGAGTLGLTGAFTISGGLNVTGAAAFASTAAFTGATTFTGIATFNGQISTPVVNDIGGYHYIDLRNPTTAYATMVTNVGAAAGWGVYSNSAAKTFQINYGSSQTGNPFEIALNGAAWFQATVGKRIGIGITPVSALHVLNPTNFLTGIRVESDGVNPSGVGLGLIGSPSAGGHDYYLFSTGAANAPGSGVFAIYDQTAAAYRFVIDSTGDVGLGGVTSPGFKLDVLGEVRVQGTTGNRVIADDFQSTSRGSMWFRQSINVWGGATYASGNASGSATLNVYNAAGTNSNDVMIARPGALSATNIGWFFSNRSNNTSIEFFGYDGTTFKAMWLADYANYLLQFWGALSSASTTAYLDLGASAATATGTGTGIGDKIALYRDTYGFGIQGARIVAFVDTTTAGFAVRVAPATGQASSGTDAVFLGGDGTISAVGTIQTTNGTTAKGGFIVNGGINGYHGEVYFTQNLGNGTLHGITSNGTGNTTMAFDVRGASNTASWRWANGTNASTTRMALTSGGALQLLTDGLQVSGGPASSYAIILNYDRSTRNVSWKMDTKDSADSGGTQWIAYADADNSVVGADQWSLWGYPRDSTGATLGNERVLTAGFLNGKLSTYTKFVAITLSVNPAFTANALTVGGKIGSTGVGTAAGAGLTAGTVQYYDNTNDFWESDGVGGWIFRNTSNSANAKIRFMCGTGATEVLTLGDTLSMKAPAWTAPTLLNSWVNQGAGYRTLRYCKDSEGFVHIEGGITAGTYSTNITLFTLAAGFRPAQIVTFIVWGNASSYNRIDIDTAGNVILVVGGGTGGNTYLSLSGITFSVN